MFTSVLPSTSTAFELAAEEATDFVSEIAPAIDSIHGLKYQRPLNVTFAPWLVHEYGLGPVSQYFGTIEDLIDQGRPWQRVRGTPAALVASMGWLDYHAITLEDSVRRRRRWHLYQMGMGELPGDDEAGRLADAEYLADLSDPARSEFFRGYFGYDVRGLVWGRSRYGNALWGDSSGVRINGGSVKWSHGRTHEVAASDTVYEWEAFGWNADFAEFASGVWPSSVSWSEVTVPWSMMGSEVTIKSWLLLQQTAHVAFYDADDVVIGYARVIRAAENLTDNENLISVAYTVRTGFGDGAGRTAAKIATVYNLAIHDGVKPFKAWLSADEAIAGSGRTVGVTDFNHEFQKTVRETIRFTLTIDPIQITPVLFAKPALTLG